MDRERAKKGKRERDSNETEMEEERDKMADDVKREGTFLRKEGEKGREIFCSTHCTDLAVRALSIGGN